MLCPYCATANPSQARFCLNCGSSLVNGKVCAGCQTLLPLNANYCFHCGAMQLAAVGTIPLASTVIPTPLPMQTPLPQPMPTPAAPAAQIPPATPPASSQPPAPSLEATAPAAAPTLTIGQLPPARPLTTMMTSLKRYLSPTVYEPLERFPTERNLITVRDHMTELLKVVRTYMPRPVFLNPQPPGQPRGGIHRGTFLFGDVSGFTPLSEQLAKYGRRGAEMITNIINQLFFELVKVLFDHGGVLLKFGGDALLGLFPADNDAEMRDGALKAVQTAIAIQNVMQKFAALEVDGEIRPLKIKCGISSGEYFAAHIGTLRSMAYVTTGHTVNRADQAEGHCTPGDIVMHQSTYDLLDHEVVKCEKRSNEGFFLVIEAPPASGDIGVTFPQEPPDGELHAQITYLVDRLDRIAPYLPAELIPRIAANPSDVQIAPEHRPVTIIFANYVGISDLIEDMGSSNPDLITQQLNNYFVEMATIVERYEGAVARMDQYSVGDRLVIFFGAPRAHEDDPSRAVSTALEMRQIVRQKFSALQTPEGIYRFRQRIGINTGHLFAGNMGAANLRQEYTLMGDDINMAARLMSKAGWGDIFITRKTHDRIHTLFDLKDRGELQVKGKQIRIPTFEVVGRRSQSDIPRGKETAFIGRDNELQQLDRIGAALLKSNRGQIVTVIGDGGVGKSRLMREFTRRLKEHDANNRILWLGTQAVSFSEKVNYWLAIQILSGILQISEETTSDEILFTLWELGEELLGKDTAREAVPFLAYMMGLKLQGEWAALVKDLDPEIRQRQTFWAAREFFSASARQRPVVIMLDDLHWADEASLSLFEAMLEVTVHAPLVFIFGFRLLRDKGCWKLRVKAVSEYPQRHSEIALNPLTETQSRLMINTLLPGANFSPDSERDLLEKAAGNPFYLEEITRSMIENGAVIPNPDSPESWLVTEKINEQSIPVTLEGAIIARLDRLTEDARHALQMASAIGRTFEMKVLHQIIQESELGTWMAQLERGDFVQPAHEIASDSYIFPNAMVQEVAYGNLLVLRRQEFHRMIGEALETLLAERISNMDDTLTIDLDGDGIPEQGVELLAYHFRQSDDRFKAMYYLDRAAQKAQREFANDTAVYHLDALIELIGTEENGWERRFDALSRRQASHRVLSRQTQREADLTVLLDLAERHQDKRRLSDVWLWFADLYDQTSRYEEAQKAALEALRLKTELGDTAGQATAQYQMGVLAYYHGDYDEAQITLQQARALQKSIKDTEGEAWSVMFLGMIQYVGGYYSDAAQYHSTAYALAHERGDTFQLGIHLTNKARVLHKLGKYEEALKNFEESLELKKRVGDRRGQTFNLIGIGQVATALEQFEKAEKSLQEALRISRDIRDNRGVSNALFSLGVMELERKNPNKALDYLKESYQLRAQLGLKSENIEDLSALARAYLDTNKHEEALKVSKMAVELFDQQQKVPGEEQEIYYNHFCVLSALDEPDAAEYLQKTREMLYSQAENITDPDDREHFLRHVTINAKILAAVEAAQLQ